MVDNPPGFSPASRPFPGLLPPIQARMVTAYDRAEGAFRWQSSGAGRTSRFAGGLRLGGACATAQGAYFRLYRGQAPPEAASTSGRPARRPQCSGGWCRSTRPLPLRPPQAAMILADSGYLIALAKPKDSLHGRAAAWSAQIREPLL